MLHRRQFLQASAAAAAGAVVLRSEDAAARTAIGNLRIDLPRSRVPLSFIIDDSTCLVNMGHYCMPQFAACYPNRADYQKPWQSWPREIPDSFVREFGQWCADHGVRGKYSIVPNPACVGWLDRELPGWSRRQLQESLELVQELMVPNWDIHPEMITHTRVIDLDTGRPMEEISPATMENSYPQQAISTDHLTAYIAYALQILKNCGLPCEGITTPGGFGGRVKETLGLAVRDAVQDVYGVSQSHYFKYVIDGDASTEPTMEHLDDSDPNNPRFTMNVPAGTGDWYGGWDGDRAVTADLYANADATSGRMVDLILRRQPAVMLCHWPGLFNQGTQVGFKAFQQNVLSLHDRFADQTQWMKVSEIGRYWAAKSLARLVQGGNTVDVDSPVSCVQFTLRGPIADPRQLTLRRGEQHQTLERRDRLATLRSGTWCRDGDDSVICFDLEPGTTTVEIV